MELPFAVPYADEVVELEPDTAPALDGYVEIISFHVGEPWQGPPGVQGADKVTVSLRQQIVAGKLVPFLYTITYWRRADGR